MRFYHGAVFCLLALLVCQIQGKRRKSRKDWRMEKLQKMVTPMQEQIEQLQKTIMSISNPVHIHLHGVSGMDSAAKDQMVVKDHDKPDHDDHHGHEHEKQDKHDDKHDKDDKHGEKQKHKCKHCNKHKHHHKHNNKDDVDRSDHSGSSEEEDESKPESDVPNQSHVHIHLKVAGESDGREGEKCSQKDDGYSEDEYIHACCKVMPNTAGETTHNVRGNVLLRQKPNKAVEVRVSLDGFDHSEREGGSSHGFHVHEFADFSSGCNSFGGHYNPSGHAHGGPDTEHKHAGDWGNIKTLGGSASDSFIASGTLYGRESMIGRGIVIHAGVDDHGKGGTHSSRTTGSAGARIACCAITHCTSDNWP